MIFYILFLHKLLFPFVIIIINTSDDNVPLGSPPPPRVLNFKETQRKPNFDI